MQRIRSQSFPQTPQAPRLPSAPFPQESFPPTPPRTPPLLTPHTIIPSFVPLRIPSPSASTDQETLDLPPTVNIPPPLRVLERPRSKSFSSVERQSYHQERRLIGLGIEADSIDLSSFTSSARQRIISTFPLPPPRQTRTDATEETTPDSISSSTMESAAATIECAMAVKRMKSSLSTLKIPPLTSPPPTCPLPPLPMTPPSDQCLLFPPSMSLRSSEGVVGTDSQKSRLRLDSYGSNSSKIRKELQSTRVTTPALRETNDLAAKNECWTFPPSPRLTVTNTTGDSSYVTAPSISRHRRESSRSEQRPKPQKVAHRRRYNSSTSSAYSGGRKDSSSIPPNSPTRITTHSNNSLLSSPPLSPKLTTIPLLPPATHVPYINPMSSQDLRLKLSFSSSTSRIHPSDSEVQSHNLDSPPKPWSHLPPGFLKSVFKSLPKMTKYNSDPSTPLILWRSTVVSCALVSKEWNVQASEILYDDVWITSLSTLRRLNSALFPGLSRRLTFMHPIRSIKLSAFYEEDWHTVYRGFENLVEAMESRGMSAGLRELELDFGIWGGVYPRRRNGRVYPVDLNAKDFPTIAEWELFVRILGNLPKLKSVVIAKRCWDEWRNDRRGVHDSNIWDTLKSLDRHTKLEKLTLRGYPDWTEGFYAPWVLRESDPWKDLTQAMQPLGRQRKVSSNGSGKLVKKDKNFKKEKGKEKIQAVNQPRLKSSFADSLRSYAIGWDVQTLFPLLREFNIDLEILKDMKRHWPESQDIGEFVSGFKIHTARSHTFTPSFPVQFYARYLSKDLTTLHAPFTPTLAKAVKRCTNLRTLEVAYLVWQSNDDREMFEIFLSRLPQSLQQLSFTWMLPLNSYLDEALNVIASRFILPFPFLPNLKTLLIGLDDPVDYEMLMKTIALQIKFADHTTTRGINVIWREAGEMRWEGSLRMGHANVERWKEPLEVFAQERQQAFKVWK